MKLLVLKVKDGATTFYPDYTWITRFSNGTTLHGAIKIENDIVFENCFEVAYVFAPINGKDADKVLAFYKKEKL